MNNTYKVIFSKTTGTFVAVSENTKSQGKSTKASKAISGIAGAVALYTIMGTAMAGPVGGNVVAGNATIGTHGNTTIINQATKNAIINWKGFDVKSHETVQFNQNGVNSVILNRVLSANPSLIDGAIKANGNVFVVNSAGVIMGKNANINVGGLVASSLDISNDDFMNGKYKFSQGTNPNAKIINEGNIQAANGGLVSLIGGQVYNSGIILAKEGTVALAAGSAVSLTLGEGPTSHSIIVEKGTIDALLDIGGAVRVDGGNIVLSARAVDGLLKNIINQHGILEASSMTKKGGKIILDGGNQGNVTIAGEIHSDGVDGGKIVATGENILVAGKLTATGSHSGGEVYIGGGARGNDAEIKHAQSVGMKKSASIDVSSTDTGNGGSAVLWSDNSTQFYGDIKATGGKNGGNGGFIETSGKQLGFNGTVNVDAPKGKSGNILLDPDIIEIVSNPIDTPGADDALLPTITASTNNTGKGSKSTVSVAALEAITSGTISLEASGYIRINNLAANGGDGALNLKENVNLVLSTTNTGDPSTWTPYTGGLGGIGFNNFTNSIIALGTGSIELNAGAYSTDGSPVSSLGYIYNSGRLTADKGNITVRASEGLTLGNIVSTNSGNISIDADSNNTGNFLFSFPNNFPYTIVTKTGNINLKSGSPGMTIRGGIDIGNGSLTLNSTNDAATNYTFLGKINATKDLTFNKGITLGTGANISTSGNLHIGSSDGAEMKTVANDSGIINFKAQGYTVGQSSLDGNQFMLVLTGYTPNSDLNIGGGPGVNLTPLTNILTNFYAVDVGNYQQMGEINISGNHTINTNLTFTTNKNINVNNANLNVDQMLILESLEGNVNLAGTLTSATSNVILNAVSENKTINSGNVNTTVDSRINSGFIGKIYASNEFNNLAGKALITADFWHISVANSGKLANTGYNINDGFRRYGCDPYGCPYPTTTLPENGFLFQESPIITVKANPITSIYGANAPAFTSYLDTSELVNGDTLASIGLTGSGNVSYVTNPTKSTSGKNKAGVYNLKTTKGSLSNEMGYTIVGSTGGTHTINKAVITPSVLGFDRVYDGSLSGSANVSISGLIGSDSVNGNSSVIAYRDKNVGTNKTMDVSYVLAGTDATNYSLSKISDVAYGSITPRPIYTFITGNDKVYDGTTTATVTGNISGVRGSDVVSINITDATFAVKDAGFQNIVANGVLVGPDAYNYALQTPTMNAGALITPKTISSILLGNNKVYDGTTAATASGSISGIIGSDSVVLQTSNINFADKNVGNSKAISAMLGLTGTDAANYVLDSTTGYTTANITPKTISSIITANNKVYDGTTAATVTGTLDGVITNDVVSLNAVNAAFSDKNAGSNKTVNTDLELSGADAGNYELSSNKASGVADINKKDASIAALGNNKTYDGTTNANINFVLTGVIGSDDINSSGTANFQDKNAGSDKAIDASVILSGTDINNYNFAGGTTQNLTTKADILKKSINATLSADAKTYDGTTNANATSTTNDFISGDDVSISTQNAAFADKNAGTAKIVTGNVSLTGNDAANYQVSSSASGLANIDKKNISATLNANDKTYDGTTTATGSATFNGVISGDDVNAVLDSLNFADKNAGTAKTVIGNVSLTGNDSNNYQASSSLSGAANIDKKSIGATLTANDKNYDGTTTATGSATFNGVISGDNVNAVLDSLNFADKNAGVNKVVSANIVLSGDDLNNYNLVNSAVNTTANIEKKNIDATLQVNNKTYDGTTSATGNVSLDGLITGDNVAVNLNNVNFADKNAGSNKVVSGTIALSGNDLNNYNLVNSAVNTTANIDKKALTATFNANNKIYDGTSSATGNVSLDGLITGDNVDVNLNNISFADKNAGSNKVVSGTIAVSGNDLNNYNLVNSAVNTTANIDKKNIDAVLQVNNKTYDGTTAATGNVSINGLIAGDNVDVNLNNISFADKNAGTAKTVNGIVGVSGNDLNNYNLVNSAVNATANIDKKTINATFNANNKTYDGTTAAIGNVALNGLIAGDNVDANLNNVSFADKNAGINKVVSGTIALSGDDLNNYDLVNSAINTTANIEKKKVDAALQVNNKTYDGTTNANATANINGLIVGDNVVVDLSNVKFADKNAGSNKIVNGVVGVSGSDSNNYDLTNSQVTGVANIDKKALSATLTANGKVYDGSTSTNATANVSGVIAGDNVVGSVASAYFTDKNAGTNKTVTADINIAGSDAANYEVDTTKVIGFADITKKRISARLNVNNKVYDGTNIANATANFDGLISGDNVTADISNIKFNDKNVGIGKNVSGSLNISGSDSKNYELPATSIVGTADITKKSIVANIIANNKTYDGTNDVQVSGNLNGVINGDSISVVVDGAAFNDKNAGTAKTVGANVALTGNDSGNYELASNKAITNADIAKKVINHNGVSIVNKVYDGSTNASAQSNGIDGVISGDNVAATVVNVQFDDKNAGNNKDVNATIALNGMDSGNYQLNSSIATGKGTILAKTISVGNTQVIDKTYDGTSNATVKGSSLNGTINGDNINVVSSGSFADKNVGNKTVNVVYGLEGQDAQNYVLSNKNEVINGVINKRSVGFTVNGDGSLSYVAGTTPNITGFNSVLSNVISGDDVSGNDFGLFLDGKLTTGKLPGKYVIGLTNLMGNDSGNYTIDYDNSLSNGPIATVAGATPTPQGSPLTEIRQLQNYVPVYANGRGIDNRAIITSVATFEESGADTFKGSRAFAVGTRSSTNSDIVIDAKEEKKEQ